MSDTPAHKRPLRVLAATPIFPNALEPHSAPFNRQQFAALATMAELSVIAPVPWFPGARWFRRWSRAGRLLPLPARESIAGLDVVHPRNPYVPKVGGAANGLLAAAGYAREFSRHRRWADVILATWAYPDGWASILLGQLLEIPVVVKLHGSDINVIARRVGPRAALRRILPRAHGIIAVSEALRAEAIALGVPAQRVRVVRNGVAGDRFFVRDRREARLALGLPAGLRIATFVGRLDERKGVGELLKAFETIATDMDADRPVGLVLVGDGAMRETCEQFADSFPGRVRVEGHVPHDEVAAYLAASDVLVLPSWSEGVPNVVLEALACGRRVVATDVGGIGEVVSREVGWLVPPRDVSRLAHALQRALRDDYDPAAIARHAPSDWRDSAAQVLDVLTEACGVAHLIQRDGRTLNQIPSAPLGAGRQAVREVSCPS